MAMSRFHSLGLGSVIALILVATCGAAPVGVSEMMTRTIYQVSHLTLHLIHLLNTSYIAIR